MDRYGNPARMSNLVTAQRALVSVLIALLLLFIVYPTTTLLRCTSTSSAVAVQHPDITLDTYDVKPAVDSPSNTVAQVAILLEHAAPQLLSLKWDSSIYAQCESKDYFVWGHCRVRQCLEFCSTFQLWHPGCEKIIADWEHYLITHDDSTPEPYRDHYWEIILDQDRELNQGVQPGHSLKVALRREESPADSPIKSRIRRPDRPNRHRSSSPKRFVGNFGPGEVQTRAISSLEDRSREGSQSTLAFVTDIPIFNETAHTFKCPADKPNGVFCTSRHGSDIIRCNGGVGELGSCSSNLALVSPIEMIYTRCWEPSPSSGDAACMKK